MADCKESNDETSRPSYVLKVDPPQESPGDSPRNSKSEEMEIQATENNTPASSSSSNQPTNKNHCYILSAAKLMTPFGGNDFSSSLTSKTRSSILRPSQLGAVTNSQPVNKTILQPSKFQNPFAKVTETFLTEANEPTKENNTSETKETKSEDESEEEVAKPTFLPLGASTKENENNSVNNSVTPCTSEPSFVFGQNLKDRVTVANDGESSEKAGSEEQRAESTNENGSTELLFSSAAAVCRTTARPGLTLTQAAQEMEEANRANKRKYSQVTPLTGEEGETNVLQINCKLFAFDKASGGWQERGRGTLRLNDRDEESRLVGRTAGTQRVILNTKVWPGMTAERAAPKSLRLTAMDVHGDIRIFIVQAAPKEIEQLHNLLLQRLKRAQERTPKKLATDH